VATNYKDILGTSSASENGTAIALSNKKEDSGSEEVNTGENSLLNAALSYAARGWPVLALHTIRNGICTCNKTNCQSPGKHPKFHQELQSSGVKSATIEESNIRRLWQMWPDANVGVATGEPAGFVVVDVDPRHGGYESIERLQEQYGGLPQTLTALTGGGGQHLLFAQPNQRISNIQSTPVMAGVLGEGVDIRGDGGYIVAPPSIHKSGNRYQWDGKPDGFDIADMPDWLLQLLTERASKAKGKSEKSKGQSIPEGRRNTSLTSLAGKLRRSGLDEAAIREALETENEQRCMPPLDSKEVARIARSVARYEPDNEANQQSAIDGVPPGFRLTEQGVFAVDPTGEKDDLFICSPLQVIASSRSHQNDAWGKLLLFRDLDGKEHSYLMPMAELAGDGNSYREQLLSLGLRIAPGRKIRELLTTYIQMAQPSARVKCVERVGWHDGLFVLPDETVGTNSNEKILFQSATRTNHNHRISGTLDEWREKVGRLCSGNARLLFAVSCAFAGPLLNLADEVGGGFHFRGPSSTGKTTALFLAGSVWGGGSAQGNLQTWRTTSNGLEAIAEIHNDGLLCLDELGQCSPVEAGEIAYTLANGSGKLRMTRSVTARKKLEWKVLFLSSGEISLADHVAQTGKRVRAGQEVRLCDINADAGVGLGAFENLHRFQTPAEFAQHLRTMSLRYFGSPIRAFLLFVAENPEQVGTAVYNFRDKFIQDNVSPDASGEVYRAAARFALVAAAGELATAEGITGWSDGEASQAAATLFKSWLQDRGSDGAGDAEAAIRQVRAFIEAHGASRFQTSRDDTHVTNRVGFIQQSENGEVTYLVLREAFRNEICKGFDYKMVEKILIERGYLLTDYKGRSTVVRRIPGQEKDQTRVYIIKSSIFGIEE
jgi:uncharacterized protein (DUF927 family)